MTGHHRSATSRLRRLQRAALAATALVLLAAGVLYAKSEAIVLGAEGYIFGYPLVLMDATRAHAQDTLGPANQLLRVRKFPDAQFKAVVRPNLDTLYTTAFLDMDAGPWVFEMPANDQRYEVMPFMDAWTNVFASPGTRLSGEHRRAAQQPFTRVPPRSVGGINSRDTQHGSDHPMFAAKPSDLLLGIHPTHSARGLRVHGARFIKTFTMTVAVDAGGTAVNQMLQPRGTARQSGEQIRGAAVLHPAIRWRCQVQHSIGQTGQPRQAVGSVQVAYQWDDTRCPKQLTALRAGRQGQHTHFTVEQLHHAHAHITAADDEQGSGGGTSACRRHRLAE